jgi:eukaryotic-like serine/threonine-protein kinase
MTVAKHKLIAPRNQTPTPSSSSTDLTTSQASQVVPEDMLSEQVQRLSLLTAVGASLWGIGLLMHLFVVGHLFGPPVPRLSIVIEALAVIVSLAEFCYLRFVPHAACTKADASLGYMVVNAIAVAMSTTFVNPPTGDMMGHLSWNVIVILVCAMIVPTSPRKMLVASLIAASTDPIAVWLAHLRGAPTPSPLVTMALFVPNYSCAVVAVWPAHVMQRFGRRLREAREMGSYQLIELLGRGGMGEVWRARHRLLSRDAAIKLVRPELLGAASDAEARTMTRRFEREAQATSVLSSPHTISVFDYGSTQDGTFYYVMELLAGRDLESLIREFGPVPSDRAIYLLRQACHSLADAHARGLVHRDIKPANIYVCRMGLEYDFVKVLDFGLVKFNNTRTIQETMMTVEHTTSGTPAFMAPEVILGDSEIDRRADIYALGCVAYFLLTGELVFEADTPMKMLLQHVQSSPLPPSQRTELRIPAELEQIVMACLEKDPARRPQDGLQLLTMLRQCRFDKWDNDVARGWWEKHLIDLSRPLAAVEAVHDADRRATVTH